MSDVTCPVAGDRRLDALVERSLGHIHKLTGLGVHFPYRESVSRITVVAFVQGAYVGGHDVALLQDIVRRKTVDNDIIDRCTYSGGKTLESKKTRNGSVVADKSLGHLIQPRGCHTRGDHLTDFRQRL